MSLKKPFGITMLLLVMCLLMIGCSEPSLKGYIVKIEDSRILVAKNINSDEEYEKMKDYSIVELKRNDISLIYVGYSDTSRFEKGNKVKVWLKTNIEDSSPPQASAKKIEVIE